jgi:hypothetical protein
MKIRTRFCALTAVSVFSAFARPTLVQAAYEYAVVPAMSNVKRTAGAHPEDGVFAAPVQIIAAQGEFEPASIVMRSATDVRQVVLKATDLTGKNGVIPAAALDLKLVKIWVQTGCAWYSYFADATGRQLIPELLVNDENLVKVDTEKLENYLRVTNVRGEEEYVWISNPQAINVPFNPQRDRVADAATFQPFTLQKNQFKQIWMTLEAPKHAAGIYRGEIRVTLDGVPAPAIPVVVRVLPFELPDPMTNYDLTRRYYVSSYNANNLSSYVKDNGGNVEQAAKRLLNEYVSFRNHNLLYPMVPSFRGGNTNLYERQLALYKEAGLRTDVVFDAVRGISDYGYLTHADRKKPLAGQDIPDYWPGEILGGFALVKKHFGPDTQVYCFGWDEPGMGLLRAQRAPWKYLHDNGLKTYSTAHAAHLLNGGYNEDFVNYGGSYTKEAAAKWHAFGARITSYANPHTGPENPDFVRRTHGVDLYLADQDGANNYMVSGSDWNDFIGTEYNFRAFNWVYPATDRHVDTIQFEGFREAIDDVRYATLLKQVAHRAIATGKTENVYAGRMALQYLALLDGKTCDLNGVRIEMANAILRLMDLLK